MEIMRHGSRARARVDGGENARGDLGEEEVAGFGAGEENEAEHLVAAMLDEANAEAASKEEEDDGGGDEERFEEKAAGTNVTERRFAHQSEKRHHDRDQNDGREASPALEPGNQGAPFVLEKRG